MNVEQWRERLVRLQRDASMLPSQVAAAASEAVSTHVGTGGGMVVNRTQDGAKVLFTGRSSPRAVARTRKQIAAAVRDKVEGLRP